MGVHDSIGAHLRAAREKRGLGVIQVAEKLRVDAAVVEALESGEFGRVGPPVFVRGHLHHYAQLLGETDEALQEHYAALEESLGLPDLSAAPRRIMQARPRARVRWPLVLVGMAVVLTGVLLWLGWSMGMLP